MSFNFLTTHYLFPIHFVFHSSCVVSGSLFTLVERKIMGLMHYRKGPNKVLISGLLQPISDALKLLTKESVKIQPLKVFMFLFGPFLGMVLMMLCWIWYESVFCLVNNKVKIFFILAVMSLSAFVFMLTSWGSNSKYSLIGGYRAISQVVSYEVCFMIFLFILFYLTNSYSFYKTKMMQEYFWFCWLSLPMFFCWVLMCMAETNRTPFDLAEGESEIVSGFNIEYGGGLFAMIFIMEYGMIMFISFITSSFFLGLSFSLVKTFMFCFMFVWIRCCFPRVRYDKLMSLCWKVCLPYSLGLLTLSGAFFS
uniref:NADH-ubiquinone oxidoreductase chain 1 n=1 Tax=Psoroptes ovis TaxID=83912 RepID=A0A075XDR7_PSOOV|nr:NADH dehydrogenase subunit 1 [Psoroptes ovis]AIH15204.1 NADH dehydrogenase subunit 1 [Psoroptes ovis]